MPLGWKFALLKFGSGISWYLSLPQVLKRYDCRGFSLEGKRKLELTSVIDRLVLCQHLFAFPQKPPWGARDVWTYISLIRTRRASENGRTDGGGLLFLKQIEGISRELCCIRRSNNILRRTVRTNTTRTALRFYQISSSIHRPVCQRTFTPWSSFPFCLPPCPLTVMIRLCFILQRHGFLLIPTTMQCASGKPPRAMPEFEWNLHSVLFQGFLNWAMPPILFLNQVCGRLLGGLSRFCVRWKNVCVLVTSYLGLDLHQYGVWHNTLGSFGRRFKILYSLIGIPKHGTGLEWTLPCHKRCHSHAPAKE